jgi:hypothetical protein
MGNHSERLHASQEKVRRAKSKFDYLERTINAYIATNPHEARIEVIDETAYVIACLKSPIPEDISWEIVEAVGHLRGALDKMIINLVDLNGRGLSGVGFPFGGLDAQGQPNTFPDGRMTGKGGIEKKLTPDQWALIVAQKPYPGGNDTLWSINQVANADKHWKGLVEVVPGVNPRISFSLNHAMSLPSAKRRVSFGASAANNFPGKQKEGEKVVLAFDPSFTDGNKNTSITSAVSFGEVRPVTGKDILSTLNAQIREVEAILETFEAQFF